MYCVNCGNKLEEDEKFCSNCGKAKEEPNIKDNIVNNSKTYINEEEDNKTANMFCMLSLILTFGVNSVLIFVGMLLPAFKELLIDSGIVGLAPIIGFILMIVARVKYPNNKFAKTLMWIYIILFIITIIAVVIGIILFFSACVSCAESMGKIG